MTHSLVIIFQRRTGSGRAGRAGCDRAERSTAIPAGRTDRSAAKTLFQRDAGDGRAGGFGATVDEAGHRIAVQSTAGR